MQNGSKNLVVMITRGTDHELSSVGFTTANGGLTAGLDVAIFLTSAGVDLVRRGGMIAARLWSFVRGLREDCVAQMLREAIDSFAGVRCYFDLLEAKPGEAVIDFGSGSGMDTFVAT